MPKRQSLIMDVIDGAIAGAVATWVMGKATTALYERENDAARQREDRARHGKTAYGVAAEKAAAMLGKELINDERKQHGQWIHWAVGIGAGAVYGALRPRSRILSASGGLLFGAGFFLLIDEAANTALGLTPPPNAFPWQAHARGLAGHLVFGGVANATVAALQQRAGPR